MRNSQIKLNMLSGLFLMAILVPQSNAKTLFSTTNNPIFFNGNLTHGGTIAADHSICLGETPQLLTNAVSPSGGNTSLEIEYLWMQTTLGASFPNTSWSPAWGTNNQATYQPPVISTTTFYIRCARRQGFSAYSAEANIVTVTVLPSPTAMIVNPPSTIEMNTTESFTAATSAWSSYEWDFDEDGTMDCSGQTCSHHFANPGSYTITLTVINNHGCEISTTHVVTVSAPLPVELTGFDASLIEDEKVLLRWKTIAEINNSHFVIQRSLDGIRFENIGVVAGAGNSSSEIRYEFQDKSPRLGNNYYRLKQVDFDYSFDYSPIKKIALEREGISLLAYPNPTTKDVYIRTLSTEKNIQLIEIYSVVGQLMRSVVVANGTGIQTIDIHDLQEGAYFAKVKYSDKRTETVMFVKN